MADVVKHLFSGFGETITSLTAGLKSAFTGFIFDTVDGVSVLSDPAQFFLILAGIGLAISVTLGCVKLVRHLISRR